MKKTLAAVALLSICLVGCESFNPSGDTARRTLSTLCALKQTELFQLWTTPEQQNAGRIICLSIGMSEGVP